MYTVVYSFSFLFFGSFVCLFVSSFPPFSRKIKLVIEAEGVRLLKIEDSYFYLTGERAEFLWFG
jgi:hypothetical protein